MTTAARPCRVLEGLVEELTAAGRVLGAHGPVVTRLFPLAPLARTYGDRVLAIGYAAGLVRPTTGGRIYYSLLSAQWAAEIVAAAFDRGDFWARVLAGYEETWRSHLGLELSVAVWFRRLASLLTAADLDALTDLAIRDGLLPIIRGTAGFNWHRKLILGALRHPGVLRIVLPRVLGRRQPVTVPGGEG